MPVINNTTKPKPFVEPVVDRVKETQPHVVPKQYRTNIIDTRWQPTSDIITHIEGSPWTVNYFSQVLGGDNEPTPPQLDTSGVNQQYINIRDLVLSVDQDITQSQNPETNEMILVGGANTYPFFVPNVNDVFFADIGNGREGIFLVTDSDRKTIFNETTHHIEYSLITDMDSALLKNNILGKVVKTYIYDKKFLQLGKNPLLLDEEYATIEDINHQQKLLLGLWLGEFFNDDLRACTIPIMEHYIYDPFINKMIQNLTDSNQHRLLRRMLDFNLDDGYAMRSTTLWDVLLEMDQSLLYSAVKRMWAIPVKVFTRYPTMRGIYHSKFNSVIYPDGKIPFNNSSAGMGTSPYEIDDPYLVDEIRSYILNGLGEYEEHPTGIVTEDLTQEPVNIHPVRRDGYYVLSQAFYDDYPIGMSHLELLVHRAINQEAFSTSKLLELCRDINTWEPLDRFYYIPVLIALLKVSILRL